MVPESVSNERVGHIVDVRCQVGMQLSESSKTVKTLSIVCDCEGGVVNTVQVAERVNARPDENSTVGCA